MKKTLAVCAMALGSLSGMSAAHAATAPVKAPAPAPHTCNTSVTRTWVGVRYDAPAYRDSKGHYNGCVLKPGTTSASVGAVQHGLNDLKLPGSTKITAFNYYGPTTTKDLMIFQRHFGLKVTGIFDADTSAEMLEPMGILP